MSDDDAPPSPVPPAAGVTLTPEVEQKIEAATLRKASLHPATSAPSSSVGTGECHGRCSKVHSRLSPPAHCQRFRPPSPSSYR